jgi:membrane fusion protein (multidrug efflux system)
MKRTLFALAVLIVVGGAAAGLYYLRAATNGDAAAADGAATEHAEAEPASHGEDGAAAEDEEGKSAVPVNVVEVAVGSVSTYLTATANLVPEDEVKVLAEAEGRVTRLLVEEGDRVESGQLLAALLRDEAEITFNKAELKASNAEMAYDRARRMFRESLISQEEFDRITMDHRIAQQELAEAGWKLDKTEIRAPFDGRLTLRQVTLGQHVREGDELFTVTDFEPLIARIYLPEPDVIALREGREVRITLKANDAVSFRGRIRQISPVVDVSTGTVKVTVEAVEPPSAVRPGGFVIIDIVRETHAEALVLPRKAVIRELQSAHVFVARDGVAERRDVSVGLEEDGRVEILSGVAAGERIVVAGQGGLKDGSRIKILQEEPDQQTASLDRRARVRTRG